MKDHAGPYEAITRILTGCDLLCFLHTWPLFLVWPLGGLRLLWPTVVCQHLLSGYTLHLSYWDMGEEGRICSAGHLPWGSRAAQQGVRP